MLSERGSKAELVAYDIRRRRAIKLLTGPLGQAAWSPDGRRIAFSRATYGRDGYLAGTGIGLFEPATGSIELLTSDGVEPAWSPDGKRIAFSSLDDTVGKRCDEDGCVPIEEIDVIDADGGGRRRLTHTRTTGEGAPTWSPDGRRLFVRTISGTSSYGARTGLATMAADGSCYRRLDGVSRFAHLDPAAWRPVPGRSC